MIRADFLDVFYIHTKLKNYEK